MRLLTFEYGQWVHYAAYATHSVLSLLVSLGVSDLNKSQFSLFRESVISIGTMCDCAKAFEKILERYDTIMAGTAQGHLRRCYRVSPVRNSGGSSALVV
jgi:hypothetical protein